MMKGQIGNLMKQAQKMREEMQRAQEELARAEIVGEAGGGGGTGVDRPPLAVNALNFSDSSVDPYSLRSCFWLSLGESAAILLIFFPHFTPIGIRGDRS